MTKIFKWSIFASVASFLIMMGLSVEPSTSENEGCFFLLVFGFCYLFMMLAAFDSSVKKMGRVGLF